MLQTPQRDLVHRKRIKSSGRTHVLGRRALPLSLVYKERELFSWTITVHKRGACSKEYNMAASHEQTAPLFDKEQIRTVIKFNALLNRAAIDIHTEIVQVVGEEHSPDISTVRRWVRTFQGNRRASVEDMPRSGRPRSSTTQTVVDKVQKLIEEDRRITVEEVSYEIGISVGSAYQILTEKLNKTKKSARWVPHILTDEEKRQRNSISQKHLRRHRIEKTDFIDRIVAADETWARLFEPELKRHSAQWRSPTSPKKAIRGYAKQKVMHIVFYTSKKVLCNYAVPPKTTVTTNYTDGCWSISSGQQ